jgi:hypothetical protein
METQPPMVRLSRTISPIRLPFIKAARKSPNAIAEGRRIIFDDDGGFLQYPEPFIELLLRQKIQTGQGQRCVR